MDSESDSSASSSSEEEQLRRRKKKKHSKKKEKRNKDKHSKKKSKRRSSSSSSDSEDSGEDQWVEAKAKGQAKGTKTKKDVVSKIDKKEEEQEWEEFGNILPTFTNDGKKTKRVQERQEQRLLSSIDMAGQTDRELNPYWKDGGKGLPSEEQDKPKAVGVGGVGDGGLAWLKKSFERAKQQAKEDGRSLEEVVAERWGSLEAFYTLLEEAERKSTGGGSEKRGRRGDDDDRGSSSSSKQFKRPSRYSDDSEEDRSSKRDRRHDRDERHRHHRRRSRDRDRDRAQSWRKPGSERKPEREVVEMEKRIIPPTSTVTSDRAPVRSSTVPEPPTTIRDSDEEMEREELNPPIQETKPAVLSDKEMNELNAKLMKAEMLGDVDAEAALKQKLNEAQKIRDEYIKNGNLPEDNPKVITKVIIGSQGKRVRDKPTDSHKEGQRVRYFPDDEKYSLKTMFEKEKMNTVEDENALFARLISKRSKATEDYDVDDIFVDNASSSKQVAKDQKRELHNVLSEEKTTKKILDGCPWCFDGKNLQKHLIVSIGETCFLCVPPFQSLTEGHCLIVPMSHVMCATMLDEDVWSEMQKFKKAIVRMFYQQEEDVVFFERAVLLKRQPHMYIECVPMPKETGELAPIYFKKAIQECETEWSQNKKVVDLKNRDVRRAVPKGLPYFSVEFGDDNCGFAHVIEDEHNFPANFAQEIIGGMMELDHQIWRKHKKEDFNAQRDKVMKFIKTWGPFDFTKGG